MAFSSAQPRAFGPMAAGTRYFFDIRDGEHLSPDEEGLILPDLASAEQETAQSLADLVRDKVRRGVHHMAVEVRTHDGPVLQTSFTWNVSYTSSSALQ
jgi:hypothetical protein